MIPQSFIQDLLGRVDIVEVIDRHVKLKKTGANYSACCPFHGEKTPSFTVSPTKQFYHCFGCGAHGSAVGFMMEYAGLGFIDAVKDLAQSVGMTVPEVRDERERAPREGPDLHDVLQKAAKHYRDHLRETPRAIDYLKDRGLTGEVAKTFGIGYAPDGWQGLGAAFAEYDSPALVAAGLVIHADEGKRYDRFRDRIMFPIVDTRGRIIGFGGRVLDKGEPKYLNSPETALFEKGRELYGLFQARNAIRQAGRVLVVEGYMDVVALHQHGVEYAVATLGTATTPVHVQKLLRQADEIVFCFDGDAAGRRAAWRALENSLTQLADGKQAKFLFLPDGEDPDSFVRKSGREAFEQQVTAATPLSAFLMDELAAQTGLSTQEGRANWLAAAKPLVKQIQAPMLSLMLRKALAERAGVTQAELDQVFEIRPARGAASAPARAAPRTARSIPRTLIEILLAEPAVAAHADRAVLTDAEALPGLPADELAALAAVLDLSLGGTGVTSPGEYFRDTPHVAVIAEAETGVARRAEDGLSPEQLAQEFAGGWRQLAELVRKGKLKLLTEKMKSAPLSEQDRRQYVALLGGAANGT